jgi:hypothetical protein
MRSLQIISKLLHDMKGTLRDARLHSLTNIIYHVLFGGVLHFVVGKRCTNE